MERSIKKLGRTPCVMAYIIIMLLITRSTFGSLLNWRQADNTYTSTIIAATASLETSTAPESAAASESATGSGSAASVSTTDSPKRPVLATALSANTEASFTASTTTASAYNSTVTGISSKLNETNDPNFCHKTFAPGVEDNPFCTPLTGDHFYINKSHEITWDTTQFAADSNITIELFDITDNATATANPTGISLLSQEVNSAVGQITVNITSSMLNGHNNITVALYANSTKNGQPYQFPGPVIYVFNTTGPGENSTSSSDHSSSSSSQKLGEKVGIPIGLIIFLIILAALAFFFFRYRRNNSGYATGKSLGQRAGTSSLRAAGRRGVGAGGHQRQESFHDEPTAGGVELQDRNRGLTGEDNWDWGRDSIGSPVSPTGNQFRDELQRQKTGSKRL